MAIDPSTLTTSKEPKTLIDTAVRLAANDHMEDHASLFVHLNSSEFLLRLNSAAEYDTLNPRQLRVAKVIKVLRDSQHAAAKQTLVKLARGGDFVGDNWLRQELLVRALVSIRPSSPEAIQFWDAQSQPTSVNRHITIDMLCENASEPAMVLLEKKLLDPGQEPEYKAIWIRDSMLRNRNAPFLLSASERMISKTLPPDLRLLLLEALCTYDREWYPGCSRPKPPPRALASLKHRDTLRTICRYAKEQLPLTPELKLAVETALTEVGGDDDRFTPRPRF